LNQFEFWSAAGGDREGCGAGDVINLVVEHPRHDPSASALLKWYRETMVSGLKRASRGPHLALMGKECARCLRHDFRWTIFRPYASISFIRL